MYVKKKKKKNSFKNIILEKLYKIKPIIHIQCENNKWRLNMLSITTALSPTFYHSSKYYVSKKGYYLMENLIVYAKY